MLIHAYRRNAAVTVDTGVGHVEFKPNAEGDVVGEATEAQAEVLLNIPEAYKVHGKAQAAVKPAKTASAPAAGGNDDGATDADRGKGKPFYLLGETAADDVDLGLMTMDELKDFAKANTFRLHHTWTEEVVRQKLFEAFDTAE